MALSPQWLDELRARVTLSAVIQRTTKLQKAGREWKACCPFHNENSPSFTVSDEKGFYHCFGCGAHGDVIRWMTDQRGMGFMDAVKELAEQAGMEVPAPDPQAAQRAQKRASLVDVTQAAQSWFVDKLRGADGASAREYLASRGFSDAIAAEFGFGYAPDDKQALSKGLASFDEAMLVESGMRIETDDGSHYDRFRDRLMLPIQDARGRVIAFGGRILSQRDGVAKYLNSPDTPLFDKGSVLYNFNRAGPASRKTDRLIVVEGYMDVIALANAGFGDAVAPLGTALTERQMELMWRIVDRPILCFDGDAAGQRAAMRAITRALPMLRPGKSFAIARLPAGKDPDDLLREQGSKALEDVLDQAVSLVETIWTVEQALAPLTTPEDKAGLKQRLLDHVDTITDQDIRALYRRELLERFSAFAFPRKERAEWRPGTSGTYRKGNLRSGAGRPAPEVVAQLRAAVGRNGRDNLFAAVLAGLCLFPGELNRHAASLARLADAGIADSETLDLLLDAAEELEDGGAAPILAQLGNAAAPDQTHFAFLRKDIRPSVAREALAEAVSLLVEKPALDAALAAATARFDSDPESAFAEQQRLLKRKLEFDRRLGQITAKRAASAALTDSDA